MGKDFRKINPNRLRWYNGLDASATLRLYQWQRERMGPFEQTWRRLHQPATRALTKMERWGAILSRPNVVAYDAFLKARIEKTRSELTAAGVSPDLNVKSSPQMQKLLYETLKLAPISRTKSGAPSCDSETLEELEKLHPEVAALPLVRRFAEERSYLSMYGEGQLKHIGYDGRVHTKFKVIRSGRLSSSEPNLQNLKSPDDDPDVAEEDDHGRWARGCWVCPEGWVWVNLDYSQVELRVAAILSQDEAMIAAFLSGRDYHEERGRQVFAVPDGTAVTKAQRRIAKVINFMIPYGATAAAVSHTLKIERVKAQEYIDAYMAASPGLDRWLRDEVKKGHISGQSWALWPKMGWTHRRPVPDIGEIGDDKLTRKRREHAERVCKNNPIQNIANCFSLCSLARIVSWVEDTGIEAEVNLTVHDNIALYVREDRWREVAREAKRLMESYDTGVLPLKVDVEIGRRDLGHLEKVKAKDLAA